MITFGTLEYAINYDRLQGVLNYERLSDGAITLWKTGIEAEEAFNELYAMQLNSDALNNHCKKQEYIASQL